MRNEEDVWLGIPPTSSALDWGWDIALFSITYGVDQWEILGQEIDLKRQSQHHSKSFFLAHGKRLTESIHRKSTVYVCGSLWCATDLFEALWLSKSHVRCSHVWVATFVQLWAAIAWADSGFSVAFWTEKDCGGWRACNQTACEIIHLISMFT